MDTDNSQTETSKGIFVQEITTPEGATQLSVQPMGVPTLAVPSMLKLAAKYVEQQLGI